MKKKVGLFGGTFDPIHLGHFAAAISMLEMLELDELWFLPAAQSPLKLDRHSAPAAHRRAMIEAVIADLPQLQLCDLELHRPPPSYTIDTVRELIDENPEIAFSLLMSDDVAVSLPRWKEAHALLELLPIAVSRRSYLLGLPQTGDQIIDTALAEGYVATPLFEVKATEVRQRLREGKTCVHLLPAPVLAYVHQHQLYTGTTD